MPKTRNIVIGVLSIAVIAACACVRRASAVTDVSAELAQMFQDDQKDRLSLEANPQPGKWKSMAARDKQHHQRVLDLVRGDKLSTGDDYYYAAMIMQHGDDPKDFMLAHILATAAALRGRKSAVLLSALSFDRLMQSVGQPQIFGSQYYREGDKPYRMREPIDTELIPDSLRGVFNAPTLAESKERLKEMNSKK